MPPAKALIPISWSRRRAMPENGRCSRPTMWPTYNVWRAELDLAEPTPAAAASALRSFIEPVYFGIAGRSWDPAAREWR